MSKSMRKKLTLSGIVLAFVAVLLVILFIFSKEKQPPESETKEQAELKVYYGYQPVTVYRPPIWYDHYNLQSVARIQAELMDCANASGEQYIILRDVLVDKARIIPETFWFIAFISPSWEQRLAGAIVMDYAFHEDGVKAFVDWEFEERPMVTGAWREPIIIYGRDFADRARGAPMILAESIWKGVNEKHPDPYLNRLFAAQALGELRERRARDLLERIMLDISDIVGIPDVQNIIAAEALGKLRSPESAPALLSAVEKGVLEAVTALENCVGQTSLSVLRDAANNSTNELVRSTARNIIMGLLDNQQMESYYFPQSERDPGWRLRLTPKFEAEVQAALLDCAKASGDEYIALRDALIPGARANPEAFRFVALISPSWEQRLAGEIIMEYVLREDGIKEFRDDIKKFIGRRTAKAEMTPKRHKAWYNEVFEWEKREFTEYARAAPMIVAEGIWKKVNDIHPSNEGTAAFALGNLRERRARELLEMIMLDTENVPGVRVPSGRNYFATEALLKLGCPESLPALLSAVERYDAMTMFDPDFESKDAKIALKGMDMTSPSVLRDIANNSTNELVISHSHIRILRYWEEHPIESFYYIQPDRKLLVAPTITPEYKAEVQDKLLELANASGEEYIALRDALIPEARANLEAFRFAAALSSSWELKLLGKVIVYYALREGEDKEFAD